ENDYLGDFDAVPAAVWEKTALLFVCTPGNPTGAVLSKEQLKKLIALSDQYGFVIASDECYSELWFDEAPTGFWKFVLKLAVMIIKPVWSSIRCLSVPICPGYVQALLQVMRHYYTPIYSTGPITAQPCRSSINWLLLQPGMMKPMWKKTAYSTEPSLTC